MLFGAKWADAKALRKVPNSDSAIYDRCKSRTGFVPFYIRKMQHATAKRAFAYGYLLRLNQGSSEVPVTLKQVSAPRLEAIHHGSRSPNAGFLFFMRGVPLARGSDRLLHFADSSFGHTEVRPSHLHGARHPASVESPSSVDSCLKLHCSLPYGAPT